MLKRIKNIPIAKTGFAKRFVSFLMITTLLAGIIPLAFNPNVHADTTVSSGGAGTSSGGSSVPTTSDLKAAGQSYCSSEPDVSECVSQYVAGYQAEDSSTAKSQSDINADCMEAGGSSTVASAKNGPSPANQDTISSCEYGYSGGVSDSVSQGNAGATSASGSASTSTTDTPGAASTPTCSSNGDVLAWVTCAVIDGVGKTVDWVFNTLVQPLLETPPVNISSGATNMNSPNYDPSHTVEIWSDFRDFGDAFLVIALLVVVFGESIGGGMIDAYTVKKVLPRLLVAAVLINVSIYIVAAAVDMTNIVGDGMSSLLQQPFEDQEASGCDKTESGSCDYYTLQIHDFSGATWAKVAGGAVLLGGGAALYAHHKADATSGKYSGGLFSRLFANSGSSASSTTGEETAANTSKGFASTALEYFIVIIVLPILLIMLAIMATVLIRRGLILFLIFISPIAFALYCLPNTEKHFRKWWDTLFRTLLIYPIIAVLFAMGNILSVTITSATSTGAAGVYASLIGVIAMFAPLFMIPFSFKLAGGILGQIHDIANRGAQMSRAAIHGNDKDPNSLRNRVRRNFAVARNEKGLNSEGFTDRVHGLASGTMIGNRAAYNQRRQERMDARRKILGAETGEADPVIKANHQNEKFQAAKADMAWASSSRQTALDNAAKYQRRAEAERAAGNTAEAASFDALANGQMATAAGWESAIAAARATPNNAATRQAAQLRLSQMGYELPDDGQAAYNKVAERVAAATGAQVQYGEEFEYDENYIDDNGNKATRTQKARKAIGFTGAQAGVATNLMNNSQYALRGEGGRAELGGINNAGGYDPAAGIGKVSHYQRGNSAKGNQSYKADLKMINDDMAIASDGSRSQQDREAAMLRASARKIDLQQEAQTATPKNFEEIQKVINGHAGIEQLNAWEKANPTSPTGGPAATKTVHQKYTVDPVTGNPTDDTMQYGAWDPDDISRGERSIDVAVTNKDRAYQQAQSMRPPSDDERDK